MSGWSIPTGLGRRLYRGAHPALLGRLLGRAKRRPGDPDLRQVAPPYPGKRIVIAEFGWPSAGYNLKAAVPGRLEQAQVLRDFVSRAEAYGIDYNIVEAIDQPWKIFEGGVGPYWGMFDASRQPKFEWTGRSPIPITGGLPASRCW